MAYRKQRTENIQLTPLKASIWRRIIAFIIDILVIYIAISPLTILFSKEIGINEELSISSLKELVSEQQKFYNIQTPMIIASISISMLALFYWSSLEYLSKQSIGKMITRIEINSLEKDLKLWQVIVRNIPKSLSVSSLSIVFMMDLIYMFFSKTSQRLTEVLSRTEVSYAA